MSKRKADFELVRFIWKRNIKYDIMLMHEVEVKNPFAFKSAKAVWQEIAQVLQNGPLKMKVTERSCRERTLELLKVHRQKERQSNAASGVHEPEMTELENLLTSVAKLQEGRKHEDVHQVYERPDKSEAEAIRAVAVASIQLSDSEEDDMNDVNVVPADGADSNQNSTSTSSASASNGTDSNRNVPSTSSANGNGSNTSRKVDSRTVDILDTRSLNIFFNDNGEEEEQQQDLSEKLMKQGRSLVKPNPKRELVQYLEKKSEKEIDVRMLEIGVRKEELKIREKEVDVKAKEMEIKNKEMEILLEKTKADSENQKKMTDFCKSKLKKRSKFESAKKSFSFQFIDLV